MNESLKFFRKNNNKDLLFKCYTIQIDYYFSIDNVETAKNLLKEIEESEEYKSDVIFNSNCFIEADQTVKLQFLMLQLELYSKLKDDKSLMLKTIALKNRLGDVYDSKIKSRLF